MAENQKVPIRTESFVTIDGVEVNINTLSQQKKDEIGAGLKMAWLNALFTGQATFNVEEQGRAES